MKKFTEIISEKDCAEMVFIPGGSFLYGNIQRLDLPAFYIDKYLVTNKQFCYFLNIVQPDMEVLKKWINLSGKFQKEKCRIQIKKNL